MSQCASEQYLQQIEKSEGVEFKMTDFPVKFGEIMSVRGVSWCFHTWYHGMESLKMLVGHATLITNFVYETVDEAHHRVGHI